jgi:mannose-6-phosphate isomerase-like protein (cupin superfamily)
MSEGARPAAGFGADPFFFTEAARGGPWVWKVGADRFEGEPLGPVRHAHDDAAEYYYMYRGSAHVETGGVEFVLEEGQLGYIPPDAPHNFTGPASDRDAWFFCVIGPNFADNKWRVQDFKPGSESLRMAVATPFVDEQLPGGGTLSAAALELRPGDDPIELMPAGLEVVYLVVDGAIELKLFGGLHGTIESGTFVHVREGLRHELSSADGGRVLRMDCGFVAWSGVETAEDARR